ncbi:MAG: hypothetical protein ACI8VR_003041, partial [Candidatus Azotimanducaceae bacterium]
VLAIMRVIDSALIAARPGFAITTRLAPRRLTRLPLFVSRAYHKYDKKQGY